MTHRTDSIWLVDPDTRVANEFNSVDPEVELPIYTPSNVVEIAYLLRLCGLSMINIQSIIDRARIWAAHMKETREILDGYAPMNEEYLRLRIPYSLELEGLSARRCAALTFECISRDQGGANEPHNSPLKCHRWLEFEVLNSSGGSIVPRQDVCRMFRSCRDYRCHLLQIQDEKVLKHMLVPGNQVVLHVRADNSGSSNYAKYARIILHYYVDIRETLFSTPRPTVQLDSTGTPTHTNESPALPVEGPVLALLKTSSIDESSPMDSPSINAGLKDTWESVVALKSPEQIVEEWVDVDNPTKTKASLTAVPPGAAQRVKADHSESRETRHTQNSESEENEKCIIS